MFRNWHKELDEMLPVASVGQDSVPTVETTVGGVPGEFNENWM